MARARGRCCPRPARFFSAQIAVALGELHARGVLYLDLKLENVMLSRTGNAVLVDFGLAQQGVDVANGGTAKRLGGTKAYLSPEAISGTQVGAAADWWAYGVVLFEMLTGGAPFVGADKKALRPRQGGRPPVPELRPREQRKVRRLRPDAVLRRRLRGRRRGPRRGARGEDGGRGFGAQARAERVRRRGPEASDAAGGAGNE